MSRSREQSAAGSVVVSAVYHEIATHPMGARDDRVSSRLAGSPSKLTFFIGF
jgi:hypothetical protein